MQNITIKANAKLNLFLKINHKKENGYHDMIMVNQSVGIYDKLKFTKKEKGFGINIIDYSTDIEKKNNLIFKAASILKEDFDFIDVEIEVAKNIPMQAGLGGGSADAAGVLRGLDRLYELNLSDEKLIDYAVKLGADVPFCLFGNTKYVEGIGEKLKDLKSDNFLFLVIKPRESMPTKDAFELFDLSDTKNYDLDFMEELQDDEKILDIEFMRKYFYNDFEQVIMEKYPIIEEIKQDFYDYGASFAMMTGSGTTVFAIYDDDTKRQKAFEMLQRKYKNIYIADTATDAIEII